MVPKYLLIDAKLILPSWFLDVSVTFRHHIKRADGLWCWRHFIFRWDPYAIFQWWLPVILFIRMRHVISYTIAYHVLHIYFTVYSWPEAFFILSSRGVFATAVMSGCHFHRSKQGWWWWWWYLPSGLMNQGTKCLTSLDSTNARATVWWLDLIWYCHACWSAYTRCWNCNSWNSIKALIVPRDSLKWAIW